MQKCLLKKLHLIRAPKTYNTHQLSAGNKPFFKISAKIKPNLKHIPLSGTLELLFYFLPFIYNAAKM